MLLLLGRGLRARKVCSGSGTIARLLQQAAGQPAIP